MPRYVAENDMPLLGVGLCIGLREALRRGQKTEKGTCEWARNASRLGVVGLQWDRFGVRWRGFDRP